MDKIERGFFFCLVKWQSMDAVRHLKSEGVKRAFRERQTRPAGRSCNAASDTNPIGHPSVTASAACLRGRHSQPPVGSI